MGFKMTEQDYIQCFTEWAKDRNLIEGASPKDQFIKLTEEVGEVAECIAKNKIDDLPQEIGDMIVVLNILANQHGYSMNDCMAKAWIKIKDRRGLMVDGFYVKESDIEKIEQVRS